MLDEALAVVRLEKVESRLDRVLQPFRPRVQEPDLVAHPVRQLRLQGGVVRPPQGAVEAHVNLFWRDVAAGVVSERPNIVIVWPMPMAVETDGRGAVLSRGILWTRSEASAETRGIAPYRGIHHVPDELCVAA